MQQGIQHFFIQFHGLFLKPGHFSRAAAAPLSVTFMFNSLGVLCPSCVYHLDPCVLLRSEPGIYFLLFNMAAVRSSYAYSVFARIIRRELPATFLHEDDQVV